MAGVGRAPSARRGEPDSRFRTGLGWLGCLCRYSSGSFTFFKVASKVIVKSLRSNISVSALHPISFELFVKSLLSCLWILRQRLAAFFAEFASLSWFTAKHLLLASVSALLSIALLITTVSLAALLR